ncbi:MAG: phosphate ABC transporter ATP-binding protein [Paludibacter sp.]|nr:phosphate ABC transporter ATP-binding protein [Paludibacter sp.]
MKSLRYRNSTRASWAEDFSFLNNGLDKSAKDKFDNDINNKADLKVKKSNLKVSELNLYIHKTHILKNVNLEIPDKKITCIIGPSGCGKSTLLKTFNRLIDDTEGVKYKGSILVDGMDIFDSKTEITEIRKKMGLLSQRPCPLPMSIYDNIAFGCKMHGEHHRKKLNQIVEEQLKAVGLWEEVKNRLHSPASKLSIGQQQRLCLARGLAVEPEFILADEATSALDPISSKHIEELFVELKENYAIIMVTHTLRQALRIADHVIFMYLGEVIEAGPADEVFNNPKQELTRKYLEGAFS